MILFIDTHSFEARVILIDDTKVVKRQAVSDRSHSEIVVPLLDDLLKSEQVELADVKEIIVVNGPGSFTGVRIGVTIAKTIAYSFNTPIKTITSLEMYGVSSMEDFDIVSIDDSKGVYSAVHKGTKYTDFKYQRRKEFDAYIEQNGYKVLTDKKIDLLKVVEYMKDKETVNPHKVNPIYIKEIDALK